MDPEQQAMIVRWYRSQFRLRTRAVKDGTARIDWVVPEYRVSLTEVRSYAESIGVELSPEDVKTIIMQTGKGN